MESHEESTLRNKLNPFVQVSPLKKVKESIEKTNVIMGERADKNIISGGEGNLNKSGIKVRL